MPQPIVTLTLNPAVDLACMAAAVTPTRKIRTFGEQLDAGGGGINVARVVHLLGGDVLALVATGGVTGLLIEELLDEAGIAWQRLPISGRNRISVNVREESTGLEYRFVPQGPTLELKDWRAALEALTTLDAEWVVASGSLPPGVPTDFYAEAATIMARKGLKFVLDTSGPALLAMKQTELELLKLSLGEFEYLLGHAAPNLTAQKSELAQLVNAGLAKKIAVTLGQNGALLGTTNGIHHVPGIKVQQQGAVGAGDSFLAGLVLGFARGLTDLKALAFGNSAGASAVATYGTARIQRADVEALYLDWCRAKHRWNGA